MRYFEKPATWTEAEAICRKHFGHLVRGKIESLFDQILCEISSLVTTLVKTLLS